MLLLLNPCHFPTFFHHLFLVDKLPDAVDPIIFVARVMPRESAVSLREVLKLLLQIVLLNGNDWFFGHNSLVGCLGGAPAQLFLGANPILV